MAGSMSRLAPVQFRNNHDSRLLNFAQLFEPPHKMLSSLTELAVCISTYVLVSRYPGIHPPSVAVLY